MKDDAPEPIPYSRQSIDEDDVAAVVAVLRSDRLTTGPAVARFEEHLSDAVGGVPVVAMSSGTAALHAAYAAAGLGSRRDLVTTPMTFAATATAALHLGARVRFADVSDDTLTLDPASVEAVATSGTAVVAAVDLAGHPADLDSLASIVERSGAVLVEDAAHSLGARYKGRPVGAVAAMTTFSFHPVKAITTGEGGAVAVKDRRWLRKVGAFRDHGMVRDPALLHNRSEGAWHQEVQSLGLNYRMPDVLAALGDSQLRKLDRFIGERASLAQRYLELLQGVDGLRLPCVDPNVVSAWHLFQVRIGGGRRREVFDRLRTAAINCQVHYLPLHLHPLFQDLGFKRGECPVAEAAYEELLSLPLYPGLTQAHQDRVIVELRAALGA